VYKKKGEESEQQLSAQEVSGEQAAVAQALAPVQPVVNRVYFAEQASFDIEIAGWSDVSESDDEVDQSRDLFD